jgi:hypothetical protein
MTIWTPIQPDFEGLYYDVPDTLTWTRKKKPLHLIEDMENMKKELLERAKEGEEEAIETLKEKYKLTCYVYKGKKII